MDARLHRQQSPPSMGMAGASAVAAAPTTTTATITTTAPVSMGMSNNAAVIATQAARPTMVKKPRERRNGVINGLAALPEGFPQKVQRFSIGTQHLVPSLIDS